MRTIRYYPGKKLTFKLFSFYIFVMKFFVSSAAISEYLLTFLFYAKLQVRLAGWHMSIRSIKGKRPLLKWVRQIIIREQALSLLHPSQSFLEFLRASVLHRVSLKKGDVFLQDRHYERILKLFFWCNLIHINGT